MKMRHVIAAVLLAAPLLAAGCTQRNLFGDSQADPAKERLKYFGGGSAVESHKNRDMSNEWGFGYPSGSGFQ